MSEAIRSSVARALALSGHKVRKATAGYAEGMPERHCGICMYLEPGGACRIVAGRIDADDWCRYFQLKTGDASGAE